MAPKNGFSARAWAQRLKDACDRARSFEESNRRLAEECNRKQRIIEILENDGKIEKRLHQSDVLELQKDLGLERERIAKLLSIHKVLEAAIFCLTRKSLQLDAAAGGSLKGNLAVIDRKFDPARELHQAQPAGAMAGYGGVSGATQEPKT